MKNFFKKGLPLLTVLFAVCLGLVLTSAKSQQATYRGKAPKYVFLFIGDGMGMPQINSTELYLTATSKGNKDYKKLNLSTFPAQGLTTTFSSNSFITDSAASATAIATGRKTESGVIGMAPDKSTSYRNISEMLKERGMKIGIVSSVSIDHATPASFYAHQPSRGDYYDIGFQLVTSNYDYFGGGGIKGNSAGKRKGKADLIQIAQENGFIVTDNKADFEKLSAHGQKVLAYDKYLDGSYALPYDLDRKADSISLAEFTKKGIDLLQGNRKGFFMMVEGGKIDWACHANDAAAAIQDTIAFDEAVGEAIAFYKKHPDDTLILITGDHECGGMAIGFAGTKYNTFFDIVKYQTKSADEFTAIVEEKINTLNSAADLAPIMEEYFGLTMPGQGSNKELELSSYEVGQLADALKRAKSGEELKDNQSYLLYGGYNPVTVTLTHILNNKAGIGWTSYSHTGVPVPTFAMGAGEDLFNGYYDNTELFDKLCSIMKIQ